MFRRIISSQLRKPSGFLGRIIGKGMAHGNIPEGRWTVDLLNLQPDMHVLEIGFGPGAAIEYAAQKVPRGHVSGTDYSAAMVKLASKRNSEVINSGHIDLRQGEVSSLSYKDNSFDRAFTVHCIYFWSEPEVCLREILRVMKPGGILAIIILPKDNWQKLKVQPSTDFFNLYNSSEVIQLLLSAGFKDARVEFYPHSEKFPGVCILAVK